MTEKQENSTEQKWYDKVETVIAIVLIILIIGLVILYFAEKSKKEKKKPTKEELKKKRLEDIQARIKVLEPQKEQLQQTEKKYFFWARFIIGLILVTLNALYLYFDNWTDFNLGDQLNINAGIALIYSFVAFILYGSPSALVRAIKKRASQVFLRNHIHVLTELQELKEEEKEIENYLVELEEKRKLELAAKQAVEEINGKENE